MSETRGHEVGDGALTASSVVTDALGMLRQSFARISLVALIFFALPAVFAAIGETAIDSLSTDVSTLTVVTAITAVAVAVSLRVLGPVAFAGFLDEAVAKEYVQGHRERLSDALRALPWKRLVIADLIVILVVEVGLALFILPGLVAFGLFGMIGPVIVQERDGVLASFRRTLRLDRRAPALVVVLVAIPFAFDEVVHEIAHRSLDAYGLGAQVAAEWVIAIVIGGTLGLLEVALASELMVRNPRSD